MKNLLLAFLLLLSLNTFAQRYTVTALQYDTQEPVLGLGIIEIQDSTISLVFKRRNSEGVEFDYSFKVVFVTTEGNVQRLELENRGSIEIETDGLFFTYLRYDAPAFNDSIINLF
jgi:hypothetical protein